MPNNAAFATTFTVAFLNTFKQTFDAKHLLVTADNLADFFIENSEVADHVEQTLFRQQTYQQLILACYHQLSTGNQVLIPTEVALITVVE